ncbi:MAG: Hsp33 family molecular chaperone HslO [Deltaproteobacteria bacterium]|nr:Hsp33 family molecular chaperone HslO [Deltaproteobacteria bacterium]
MSETKPVILRDHVLRAMTHDGSFRVLTVDATKTSQDIIALQKAKGSDALHLAELIAAAALFRETMAPDLRAQCVLLGAQGSGRFAVDAQPEGATRGLLRVGDGHSHVLLGEGARLEMVRTLPAGRGHRGIVGIADGDTVEVAVMKYLQQSEQIVSTLRLYVTTDALGGVQSMRGFLVQLTPETLEGPLAVMTERLAGDDALFEAIARDRTKPLSALMDELLYGFEHTITGNNRLRSECSCSEERMLGSLASLPRADLRELVASGEPIEMVCEYCTRNYMVPPALLSGVLQIS